MIPKNNKSPLLSSGLCSLLLALLLCAGTHCAGMQKPDAAYLDREFARVIDMVLRDRENMKKLAGRRVGSNGYYYILQADGRLIYHPVTPLIGMRFGEDPVTRKILETRTGCIRNNSEGIMRLLIFRRCGDSMILVLSIPPDEVAGEGLACDMPVSPRTSNDDE
jgi:hypothetical protein